MQHMKPGDMLHVKNTIDLNNIVPHNKNWLIYSGSDTRPPCSPSMWVVSFGTFKVRGKGYLIG